MIIPYKITEQRRVECEFMVLLKLISLAGMCEDQHDYLISATLFESTNKSSATKSKPNILCRMQHQMPYIISTKWCCVCTSNVWYHKRLVLKGHKKTGNQNDDHTADKWSHMGTALSTVNNLRNAISEWLDDHPLSAKHTISFSATSPMGGSTELPGNSTLPHAARGGSRVH